MGKLTRLILSALIMFSTFLQFAYAETVDSQTRIAAKINRLKLVCDAENNLNAKIIEYLNLNGSFTIAASKLGPSGAVTSAFLTTIGLDDLTSYKQSPFAADPIRVVVTATDVTIQNGLDYIDGTTEPMYKEYYLTQKKLVGSVTFPTNKSSWKIQIPAATKTIMAVAEAAAQSGSNIYFGTTAPTDTTKIWAKPSADGTLEYLYWDGTKWVSYGSVNSTTGGLNSCLNNIPNFDTLSHIPGTSNMCAVIPDGEYMKKYWWSATENKWLPEATGGGSSGVYMGAASIKELACDIFSKSGGSVAEVGVMTDGTYKSLNGAVSFIKIDAVTTGGYWKQNLATPGFAVFKDMAGAIAHKSSFAVGTKGYVCKADKTAAYELIKTSFDRWAYIGYDFNKVASSFSNAPEDDGRYVLSWDTVTARADAKKKYFQSSGTGNSLVWSSIYNYDNSLVNTNDITQNIKLSPAGRSNFSTGAPNTLYLTINNDCGTLNNCNGVNSATYGGEAISNWDNMYSWYYGSAGLIDAQPFASIAAVYDAAIKPQAAIVAGTVYLKGADSNSALCYKSTSGTWYTRLGAAIPINLLSSGTPQMPPSQTCSTAQFSGSSLILSARKDITDWISAPMSSTAAYNGKIYQKMVTGTDGYWQTTDNVEYITNGSRSNLPMADSTSSKLWLTRIVGTEPNYTTTGVTYSGDANFKQWFYSATGTIVQNLLDAVPCAWSACYANSTAITAGIALNSDAKLLVYQGGYWKQQSNLTNLLAKKMAIYHTDTIIVNYAVGQAGNGLWYDGCEGGLKTFEDATAYCTSIGMRLPSYYTREIRSLETNGVPSCTDANNNFLGYTWTTSEYAGEHDHWRWWNLTNTFGAGGYYGTLYTRCVK